VKYKKYLNGPQIILQLKIVLDYMSIIVTIRMCVCIAKVSSRFVTRVSPASQVKNWIFGVC